MKIMTTNVQEMIIGVPLDICTALAQQMRFRQSVFYNPCPLSTPSLYSLSLSLLSLLYSPISSLFPLCTFWRFFSPHKAISDLKLHSPCPAAEILARCVIYSSSSLLYSTLYPLSLYPISPVSILFLLPL